MQMPATITRCIPARRERRGAFGDGEISVSSHAGDLQLQPRNACAIRSRHDRVVRRRRWGERVAECCHVGQGSSNRRTSHPRVRQPTPRLGSPPTRRCASWSVRRRAEVSIRPRGAGPAARGHIAAPAATGGPHARSQTRGTRCASEGRSEPADPLHKRAGVSVRPPLHKRAGPPARTCIYPLHERAGDPCTNVHPTTLNRTVRTDQ